MSDGQLLYAVLVALYLSECVSWCRTGSAVLRTWGRDWRPTLGPPLLGNRAGRLVPLPPLPLPGAAVAVHHLPLILAPDGLCAATPLTFPGGERPAQSGRFLPWDGLGAVTTDGRRLLVDGAVLCVLPSEALAREAARQATRLRDAPPSARRRLAEELFAAGADAAAAHARLDEALRLARPLRWTGLALLLAVFLAAPAVAWGWGTGWGVIAGAGALLAATPAGVILFRRAHRALYPDGSAERNMQTAKMILCPVAVIRAGDQLLLDAVAAWRPLAVAGALGLDGFAAALRRDLLHPLGGPLSDPRAAAACAWFLSRHGETEDAPPPDPGGLPAYCPRCHALFTDAAGTCPDCAGVRLHPFPAPTA